jgi:hypothetical protein
LAENSHRYIFDVFDDDDMNDMNRDRGMVQVWVTARGGADLLVKAERVVRMGKML